VLAVALATVVALLAGATVAALVSLTRTLRAVRATLTVLQDETAALLDAAFDAVHDATVEVERVERLVSSAERLSDAVDSASRLAYRTLASPVVKAMAFGTGVGRAAQRLRDGEAPPRDRRRRRRARRAS
jgi:uncharacterized protein YoxC